MPRRNNFGEAKVTKNSKKGVLIAPQNYRQKCYISIKSLLCHVEMARARGDTEADRQHT